MSLHVKDGKSGGLGYGLSYISAQQLGRLVSSDFDQGELHPSRNGLSLISTDRLSINLNEVWPLGAEWQLPGDRDPPPSPQPCSPALRSVRAFCLKPWRSGGQEAWPGLTPPVRAATPIKAMGSEEYTTWSLSLVRIESRLLWAD